MTTEQTPFEQIFDIEPGTTPTIMANVVSKPLGEMIDPETGEVIERKVDAVSAEFKQEERIEDLKIDKQIDKVHGAALAAFEAQHALSQQVDPKFSARNSEVAAQYLNIALDSIKTRADVKYKRQKIRVAERMDGVSSVQNNLIVADRNDVLRSLFKQDFEKPLHQQMRDEVNPNKDN
jgi:hypothetical protein